MQNAGNTFDVYLAGSFDLEQVEAPKTFRELAEKLRDYWAIPSGDFSHPVMKFLVALHAKSPLRFEPGAIRQRNIRAFYFAYSLLTGELRTSVIQDELQRAGGQEAFVLMDDPDLSIEWSDNCDSIILRSKDRLLSIGVIPGNDLQVQFEQNMVPCSLSADEIAMMEKEYSGRVQVMDNALGRINEVFVFYNRHLPYKTLLSICRSLDARITVVTVPQSRLMHCVDSYLESLKKGECDQSLLQCIRDQQLHQKSRLKNTIELMCEEDCANLLIKNKIEYIKKWKELRDKIVLEEADDHEQNTRKQLKSDGIDHQKVTIITSKNLESRWARDYFLLGYSHTGQALFLESSVQLLKRNRALAEELVSTPELRRKWTSQDIHLPFEGGDIRAVGPYMFMGENTFERGIDEVQSIIGLHKKVRIGSTSATSAERTETALLLKKEYEALSGREFVLVGEGDTIPQAMLHIDMFLTFLPNPGKKPVIIVADMSETATLLNGLSVEETAQIERSMLSASLTSDELNNSSSFWLYRGLFLRHDLIQILMHGGLQRYVTVFNKSGYRIELQQRLDAAAVWFKERGYRVLRAPCAAPPVCYMNYWSQRNGVAILETIQDNAYRVYNNVLVEMYIDTNSVLHRMVYMPHYGFIPLEKRLVEIYNSLGYKVVFVPYMWEPAFGNGGLECLTTEVRGHFNDKKPRFPN